jgi:nicotinamide-nucleotide amidase
MAAGARRLCECDIALAVTGITAAGNGSSDKPVGLCYWAVAYPGGTIVRDRVFSGDRDEIQISVAYAALDLVRRVSSGTLDATEPEAFTPGPAAR